MRNVAFEKFLKGPQVCFVNVGNGPVIKVGVSPIQKAIALARDQFGGLVRTGFFRPNKQIDEMLASLVNQRRYCPVIEIIETAANQRKSLTGKIDNRRSKIELRIQPGFYRVLVGGSDVC